MLLKGIVIPTEVPKNMSKWCKLRLNLYRSQLQVLSIKVHASFKSQPANDGIEKLVFSARLKRDLSARFKRVFSARLKRDETQTSADIVISNLQGEGNTNHRLRKYAISMTSYCERKLGLRGRWTGITGNLLAEASSGRTKGSQNQGCCIVDTAPQDNSRRDPAVIPKLGSADSRLKANNVRCVETSKSIRMLVVCTSGVKCTYSHRHSWKKTRTFCTFGRLYI